MHDVPQGDGTRDVKLLPWRYREGHAFGMIVRFVSFVPPSDQRVQGLQEQ